MSLSTRNTPESIGATVRSWREQRGWTRTRLAAETQIPLPVISDIEAGWEGTDVPRLKRILEALGGCSIRIVTPEEA